MQQVIELLQKVNGFLHQISEYKLEVIEQKRILNQLLQDVNRHIQEKI